MNERLQQALDFANYRQTLNNQLHKLKVATENTLIIAESGGKFTIDRELISFLNYIAGVGKKDVILLDDNLVPIKIDSVKEFLSKITDRYFNVTNDYYIQVQSIKKSRDVKSLLGIKDT